MAGSSIYDLSGMRLTNGGAMMSVKRQIEVFSAGCSLCEDTVKLVQQIACPSCEISVLDMQDRAVAERATALGIRSVPAVVIDGELADCCAGRGPGAAKLRSAGVGQSL